MKIPMMFFNAVFLSVLLSACAMEQPQEAKDSVHESMLEVQEAIPPPRKPELLAELIQSKENELQMRDYFNAANDELWSKAQEMENLAKYVEELSKGELKAVEIAELARLKEETRSLQRENALLKERIKILEETSLGAADTQKLKAQASELRARIEKLKQEYVPPEKYQAALDATQKSKSESSALQAENAGLKEALTAAKLRGDEAWKLTEQLTAKFDELSRKYERLNEFLRKKN